MLRPCMCAHVVLLLVLVTTGLGLPHPYRLRVKDKQQRVQHYEVTLDQLRALIVSTQRFTNNIHLKLYGPMISKYFKTKVIT